jgi:hypothetical protein
MEIFYRDFPETKYFSLLIHSWIMFAVKIRIFFCLFCDLTHKLQELLVLIHGLATACGFYESKPEDMSVVFLPSFFWFVETSGNARLMITFAGIIM